MRIKESAILKDNIIYTGKRHHNVIKKMITRGVRFKQSDIQGFVTECGKFFSREESEKIARECGQLKGKLLGSVLTSEDLW